MNDDTVQFYREPDAFDAFVRNGELTQEFYTSTKEDKSGTIIFWLLLIIACCVSFILAGLLVWGYVR
jgi:hypothetical protein